MKICIVVPSFFPAVCYGGVIFAPYYLGLELAKLNEEVIVSTTDANGPASRLPIAANVPVQLAPGYNAVYHRNIFRDQFSINFLLNAWKQIKWADVVFINALFCPVIPIALFYSKLFDRPFVLSPRGALGTWCLSQGNQFKRIWLNILIRPFGKHITWHATSEQEAKEILALFPHAHILQIPDGVRMQDFAAPVALTRTEFAQRFLHLVKSPSHILVSLGRLHKKKGFDILIQSFAVIQTTYPNAILVIAGPDEGARQFILNLVDAMHLKGSVFLIDPLADQDKTDFLANADLFALSSHNENFGIVYAEALAAGTPVVATRNTPWKEVEEFNCGRWVPNTVGDVSNAIAEMFAIENTAEMRNNARELINRYYTWEAIAKRFQSTLAELIKRD